jgi:hypothetical protein
MDMLDTRTSVSRDKHLSAGDWLLEPNIFPSNFTIGAAHHFNIESSEPSGAHFVRRQSDRR